MILILFKNQFFKNYSNERSGNIFSSKLIDFFPKIYFQFLKKVIFRDKEVDSFPSVIEDSVSNDDISISKNFFIDREPNSFQVYSSQYHYGYFCGKINYNK